jgi:hypothetical protein
MVNHSHIAGRTQTVLGRQEVSLHNLEATSLAP